MLNGQYEGTIAERRLVDNKKIYVSGTDKYPVDENKIETSIEVLRSRMDTVPTIGFGILFPGSDIKLFGIHPIHQRSFYFNVYIFEEENLMLKNLEELCYLECEIIGAESKILRESESKEDYLSTWFMQDKFVRKHGFKL
ncbi:MAG: hypothetical protein KJ906_03935 [Nanoarchaeota archaeon]|nr:hypothetical protein [Nanoarchaeota archaeon]